MKSNARPALTPRALVAGLVLMVATVFWVMYGLKWDIAHAAMISLLYNAVFALFAVTVVNLPLKRLAPTFIVLWRPQMTLWARCI